MERLSAHREEERLVAERAADWLHRLETADAQERAAFMAWLKESPRHVREMLLAGTWDKVLDSLDPKRRVDIDELFARGQNDVVCLKSPADASPVRSAQHASEPDRGSCWRWGFAAAALLAVIAVWAPMTFVGGSYSTAIGEQRAFELEDGSMIHLNADSRVKVDFSDTVRDVHLLDGQAIFKVQHEAARPFRVHVNETYIQAVGTQFDVHRRLDRVTVAVLEGKVRISTGETAQRPSSRTADGVRETPALATLKAGEAANIATGGEITRPAVVDVSEVTAWRQRRLVFRKDTLADMAAEFNRYNRSPQIRVEGEAFQARQFNGVFDADDPQSLIRFLENMDGIAVERNGSEIVLQAR